VTALRHPAFDDVEVSVPDDEVARWTAQGWLAPESAPNPNPSAPAEEHEPHEENA